MSTGEQGRQFQSLRRLHCCSGLNDLTELPPSIVTRTKYFFNEYLACVECMESMICKMENGEIERTSTTTSSNLSFSTIDKFPTEVLVKIFTDLNPRDRVLIESICKRWQELSSEPWKWTEVLYLQSAFSQFLPVTNAALESILCRCGAYLRTLDFSGTPMNFLNNESLTIIAKSCQKLNNINLTGLCVDGTALKMFAELCGDRLETIVYQKGEFLAEEDFWWLFRFCPNLKTVNFGWCLGLIGRCFGLLNSRLQYVYLEGCAGLHGDAIIEMCFASPELRRLIIDGCVKLNNESLDLISHSFVNLEVFSMKHGLYRTVTSVGMCQLEQLKCLYELNLDGNKLVDDMVLKSIAAGCAGSLRVITLSQAGKKETLTSNGLMELAVCKKLTEIDFSYLSSVTDLVLEGLSKANPTLKLVRLCGCCCISEKGIEALVKNCTLLEEVDVFGCCLAVIYRSIEKIFRVNRCTQLTIKFGRLSCKLHKLFLLVKNLPGDRVDVSFKLM